MPLVKIETGKAWSASRKKEITESLLEGYNSCQDEAGAGRGRPAARVLKPGLLLTGPSD